VKKEILEEKREKREILENLDLREIKGYKENPGLREIKGYKENPGLRETKGILEDLRETGEILALRG
jgi:hypothetical protein